MGNKCMGNILLSICIPLHNRTETVIEHIECLLKCRDSRFDIVVSDTSDEGEDFCSKWGGSDNRVKIYRFPTNTAPGINWKNALTCADGLFAFHLNDRDVILQESIPSLLDFLEHNKKFCGGICKYVPTNQEPLLFISKDDALLNVPYFSSHTTGFIFNTNELESVVDLNDIFMMKNGTHPHDILLGRLAQKGNLFIYTKEVWEYASAEFYKKNISGVSSIKTGLFFEPKARILELKDAIDDLKELDFAYKIKQKKIKQMYRTYLSLATSGYFYFLESEHETAHYGIKQQKIGILKKYKLSMEILDSFAEKFHFSAEEKSEYKKWLIKSLMIPVVAKYTSKINNPLFRNMLRRMRVKRELKDNALLR